MKTVSYTTGDLPVLAEVSYSHNIIISCSGDSPKVYSSQPMFESDIEVSSILIQSTTHTSTQSLHQDHIPYHDHDPLSMYCTQETILQESNDIGFCSLLQCFQCCCLKFILCTRSSHFYSNFSTQARKG